MPEPAETLPLTDVFAPPRRAPASCVDVSDLAPELPRKTIESYTTIDDDFKRASACNVPRVFGDIIPWRWRDR